MKKINSILILFLLCHIAMYGQDGNDYLKEINNCLKNSDCTGAQKWYLAYKNVTGKTNNSIETKIKDCEDSKIKIPKTKVVIEWADIPAGTFIMGSPENEPERYRDEVQHEVKLNGFKISKCEITFAQYDAFCEATGREKPNDNG